MSTMRLATKRSAHRPRLASCALFAASVLTGGCSVTDVSFTRLNTPPHALVARDPQHVKVFSSGPPRRPYIDVGLITVEQGDIGASAPQALIRMLRETAAERGCDALVLSTPSSKSHSALNGFVDQTDSYRVYSGTCIVYTNEEAVGAMTGGGE